MSSIEQQFSFCILLYLQHVELEELANFKEVLLALAFQAKYICITTQKLYAHYTHYAHRTMTKLEH